MALLEALFDDMSDLSKAYFPSFDEARAAASQEAAKAGFAIGIRNRKEKKVLMACTKSRPIRDHSVPNLHPSKRRQSRSQQTKCPYRVWIKEKAAGWEIEAPTCPDHNHPSIKADAFATYRNQTIKVYQERILSLINAGLKPSRIADAISAEIAASDQPDLARPTAKDISNLIDRHRREHV